MNKNRHRKQGAFSLIEILVALIVLAIGMLGIARMLLLSHKASTSNYIRQNAIQSAYNMLDRMHANRQAALDGNYTGGNLVSSGAPTAPSTPSVNCSTSSCSTAELANYDTFIWLTRDVAQLPNGCGKIEVANTQVTVTVQWDDSPIDKTLGITNSTPTQLSVSTAL